MHTHMQILRDMPEDRSCLAPTISHTAGETYTWQCMIRAPSIKLHGSNSPCANCDRGYACLSGRRSSSGRHCTRVCEPNSCCVSFQSLARKCRPVVQPTHVTSYELLPHCEIHGAVCRRQSNQLFSLGDRWPLSDTECWRSHVEKPVASCSLPWPAVPSRRTSVIIYHHPLTSCSHA
jgi:hypothetical protein